MQLVATQDRIGKDRIGKDRIGENRKDEDRLENGAQRPPLGAQAQESSSSSSFSIASFLSIIL